MLLQKPLGAAHGVITQGRARIKAFMKLDVMHEARGLHLNLKTFGFG